MTLRPDLRALRTLAALVLALAFSATAGAEENARLQPSTPLDSAPSVAADEVAAPTAPANRVIVRWNPATRRLEEPDAVTRARVFAALEADLAARFRPSSATDPAVAEKVASGGYKLRLPFSLLSAAVVHRDPGGTLTTSCRDGFDSVPPQGEATVHAAEAGEGNAP